MTATTETPDLPLLDRAYAAIMGQVVTHRAAPHFTELAAMVEVDIERARSLVHELVAMTPGWVHPGTDVAASFPPFNLMPTQYRVSIDGAGGWYAQCGLEATAIRWLVPGREVTIEAPCLCCGEAMTITMTDEEITTVEPEAIVGYTSAEVGGDAATRPFR